MSAPDTERAPPAGVGEVVAERYELLEPLGSGVSGKVFRARDLYLGAEPEIVALKILHPELALDRQFAGRFRREAKVLSRLEGRHLCAMIEVVEEGDVLALALECVHGPSLEEFLRGRRTLPLDEIVEVATQICEALQIAHDAGVVHRDLKPSNILIEGGHVAPDASFRGMLCVKVVDFGLAKLVHGEAGGTVLTERNMIFGTPEYMAPEQVAGEPVGIEADIYSTGVLVYWMLVGRPPFEHPTSLATMRAKLSEAPPSPRAVVPERAIPSALDAVVMQALARQPKDRFASAREFAAALVGAADPASASAPTRDDGLGDTSLDVAAPGTTMRSLEKEASGVGRGARVEIVMPESSQTTRASRGGPSHVRKPRQSERGADSRQRDSGADGPGPSTWPAGVRFEEDRTWLGVAIVVGVAAVVLGAWLGIR